MTGRLDGLGCLITGATGIAAATAHRFADEGAHVLVIAKSSDECLSLGLPFAIADLSDEGAVVSAFEQSRLTLDRLDAVFAVAGGSGRRFGDGVLHETTQAAWDATFTLNATPAFLVAREAVKQMDEQRPDDDGVRGSIVLMASVVAFDPSPTFFGTHAYAAAKAAIIGLTKSAAATYVGRGIRFNVLAPGSVDTPMAARAAADPATLGYLERKQPLAGGMLDPEDIADAAVYLCSRESRRVTGQTIVVDGGWTVRGDDR